MSDKPSILFLAIIHPGFVPYQADRYGLSRTLDILPHKYSILALTGWLRENGCEGYYLSFDIGDAFTETGLARIDSMIDEKHPDAIGFSLTTEEMSFTYRLIEKLKSAHPEIPIIIGGPHASAMAEDTLMRMPSIDYVVIGEGEHTVTELLGKLSSGEGESSIHDVDGVAYRNEEGKIIVTAERERIDDLDILPRPAYDLLFKKDDPGNSEIPFPLVTSYGCKFHCTFCATAHGQYKSMSASKAVDIIEWAMLEYGVGYIAIRDSLWPPSHKWVDEFCDEIEKRELIVRFHFSAHVETLSVKHLRRLKKIGARTIAIGYESGDATILKKMRKGMNLKMARKTAKAVNEVGIFSVAFFLFGTPGETRESIRKSVEFARELNSSITFFNILSPLPGAGMFEFVHLEDKDWWVDEGERPSICRLSPDELLELHQDAYLKYPVRFSYLWQHAVAGNLPREYKLVAWRIFWVHFRRYNLGMIERFGPARWLIQRLKQIGSSGRTA